MSIIRWYNILLTVTAQYLAAIITLNHKQSVWITLQDPKLHLIVLATIFVIAGGFIINSFYDLEKDLINRPKQTVFDRLISKKFCLNFYILLNVIGLLTAFLDSFNIFVFFSTFAFGLWFYSHKLQKLAVIGEISASLLTVASFFSIGLYYQHFRLIYFVYGSWVMCLIFGRELIKGIESIKGDALFGYDSIPLQLGLNRTRKLLYAVGILSLVPLALVFSWTEIITFKLLIGFAGGLTLHSLFLVKKLEEPKQFKTINTRFKILLVSGVLWIIFL